MSKCIYEITCYFIENGHFRRERNWMYFFDKETALDVVKNNQTDIFENNYYNYATVTKKHPGLECQDNRVILYKADYLEGEMYPHSIKYVEEKDLPTAKCFWYGYVTEENL